MKELGLQSFVRVRRYRSYKGNYGKVAPNILKRDFRADKLNLKWVTDVTQFNVLDTKIYLSPIVDLFNGEVISYNISESPNFHQIEDMLDKAFIRISDNTNLILHSDQGSVYASKAYNDLLPMYVVRSMSRAGTPTDNSAMESINGWIKAELFMDFHVTGERPVYEEVNEYIKFFNEERPAYALSYLTPKQYRERYAA